jgi:uncharacterized protein (UPF0261 family)
MSIAIIGMLDEREESLRLLQKCIQAIGHQTTLTDISMGKGAINPTLRADISGDELAGAAGTTLETIKGLMAEDEKKATAVMSEGLKIKLLENYKKGGLQAVIAVAGMTGSLISLPAMKSLPFGVPKLLISSAMAMPSHARSLSEFFGVRDITVMHSVVDTVGLNPFVRKLMVNGAGSICGMVDAFNPDQKEQKPTIAMTEWGYCDKGAHYVRALLEEYYDVVSFHAVGVGEKAAAELVDDGLFEAFIDLVPGGFSEYFMGGNRATGPDRLNAGCRSGKPYILSPCGFDMIGCGPIQRRDHADPLWESRKLSERKLFIQDAMRVQARTNPEEMKMIARKMARALNEHPDKNLVKIVIPLQGLSSLSKKNGPLYDPESDEAFFKELERRVDSRIDIIKVNSHIDTRDFAVAVADALSRASA